MQQLFFELIQVALGVRLCLSHSPSADEFDELYAMAKKQSLIGICFVGLQRLQHQRQVVPKMTYLSWMGMAAIVQQRNEIVNQRCVEIQARLTSDGLRACILKGQGIGQLYSNSLRGFRQSGDIDVWVDAEEERVLHWVRNYQRELNFDYKHVHLDVFEDTSVEVHYRPSTSRVPWLMRRVEQFNREKACWNNSVALGNGEINLPSIEFNLVFVLQHIFGHLFAEEMNLKQYLDYYFVLKAAREEGTDVQEAYRWMQHIGMASFAKATMWLLHEVFGMPTEWMICESDADEGRFLLNRVMAKEQKQKSGVHGSMRWHLSVFWTHQIKNLHLLTHYPLEVLFSSTWLVRHFFWKRMWKMQHKELFA